MAGNVIFMGSGKVDSLYGNVASPIRSIIEEKVESAEQFMASEHIYVKDDLKGYSGLYTYLTNLGDFENVGEGGAYPIDTFEEGYRKIITPFTWKDSFSLTAEMLEDSSLSKSIGRASAFVQAYKRTREKYAMTLLNNGFNSSVTLGKQSYDATGADGQPFFSASHPSKTKRGGPQSNFYDGALTYDNIAKAIEKMQNRCDDDGNLLNIMPDTFIIRNSAAAKKAVMNFLGADSIFGSSDNSFNYNYGSYNVIISPYMDAIPGCTDEQLIILDSQTNKNTFGLVYAERVPLTIRQYVEDKTDNIVYNGRARFAYGLVDWRVATMIAAGKGGTSLA